VNLKNLTQSSNYLFRDKPDADGAKAYCIGIIKTDLQERKKHFL